MRARLSVSLLLALTLPIPSLARAQGAPALEAEAEPASRATRHSSRQRFRIASAILGETRHVGIALPPSYAASAVGRRYPVVVVLDGEASLTPAISVADELAKYGQVPEMVIVAVENTDRLRDLTPPGLSVSGSSTHEGGDRFLDFIERELLPAVDRRFRTAAPRTLVGHSSGGIIATYAAATRSTYRAVVALDTPVELGDQWLVARLVARAKAAPSALRYAAIDARFPFPDDAWQTLASAAPASWSLHHEHLAGDRTSRCRCSACTSACARCSPTTRCSPRRRSRRRAPSATTRR